MSDWTTDWPTEPGWYFSWIEGAADHQTNARDIQPVRVRTVGTEPRTHPAYIREGHFFYKAEYATETVWWLPFKMPEFKP